MFGPIHSRLRDIGGSEQEVFYLHVSPKECILDGTIHYLTAYRTAMKGERGGRREWCYTKMPYRIGMARLVSVYLVVF